MSAPKLYGLLLTGGKSSRMGRDKAALEYGGQSQADRAFALLEKVCERVFVSSRRDQTELPGRAGRPQIHDVVENVGPAGGILSAFKTHPDCAWLVLACDLPFLSESVLRDLVTRRRTDQLASAYRSGNDGLPEPLCAIYEPGYLPHLEKFLAEDVRCPRKILIRLGVPLLELPDARALDNVNEPGEFEAAQQQLTTKRVRVQYFASLREQAGRDDEDVRTTVRTSEELYRELAKKYGFRLAADRIRAGVNGSFVAMTDPLRDGDEVVFVAPVAGG